MMQREYKLLDVPRNKLLEFGFKQVGRKYFFLKCLYKNTIVARFIADFDSNGMEWEVYDTTNQKPYFAFYSNINGDNNKVAISVIDCFNEVISKMAQAGIIKGEE